jgi:hypothetical protein
VPFDREEGLSYILLRLSFSRSFKKSRLKMHDPVVHYILLPDTLTTHYGPDPLATSNTSYMLFLARVEAMLTLKGWDWE